MGWRACAGRTFLTCLDLATHWKERDDRHAIASCFDAFVIATETTKRIMGPSMLRLWQTFPPPQYNRRLQKVRRYPSLTSYNDNGQETRFTYDERLDEDKLLSSATVNQPALGSALPSSHRGTQRLRIVILHPTVWRQGYGTTFESLRTGLQLSWISRHIKHSTACSSRRLSAEQAQGKEHRPNTT